MIKLLVFSLLFASLGRAALFFDQTRITLEATKLVPQLETEFTFTNSGTAEVTVTDITTSCTCTVTALEKRTYGADEKGAIKVRFDVGDREGEQNRTITVVTADGTAQILNLIVKLPLRTLITPRLLLFRAKDTDDKSNTVTFYQDLPVTILEVTSSSPAFTLTTAVEKPGSVFKFTAHLVNPASTTPVRATVRVRSQGASGTVSLTTYYLRYEGSVPAS